MEAHPPIKHAGSLTVWDSGFKCLFWPSCMEYATPPPLPMLSLVIVHTVGVNVILNGTLSKYAVRLAGDLSRVYPASKPKASGIGLNPPEGLNEDKP